MRAHALIAIALTVAAIGVGCSKSEAGSSGAPPTGTTGITIAPGTTGGVSVQGAPPLSGIPAACAAFKACCPPGGTGPAGLACGLAPAAANGDCSKALESVRGIFKEQGITAPPGCNDGGGNGSGSGQGTGSGRNRRKVEGQHAP